MSCERGSVEPVLIKAWPDAAQALGVGKSKLWELIATGELESVKIGHSRLVPPAALHSYVERLREDAKAQHGGADA